MLVIKRIPWSSGYLHILFGVVFIAEGLKVIMFLLFFPCRIWSHFWHCLISRSVLSLPCFSLFPFQQKRNRARGHFCAHSWPPPLLVQGYPLAFFFFLFSMICQLFCTQIRDVMWAMPVMRMKYKRFKKKMKWKTRKFQLNSETLVSEHGRARGELLLSYKMEMDTCVLIINQREDDSSSAWEIEYSSD